MRAQGGQIPSGSLYTFGTGDREVFIPATTNSAHVPTITMSLGSGLLSQFTTDQLREEIRRRGGDDGAAGVAARVA